MFIFLLEIFTVLAIGAILLWLLRQIRLSSKRENNLLEILCEGVILCDRKGKIVRLNRAAKRILEGGERLLAGKSFFTSGSGIDPVLFDKCCQILRQTVTTGSGQPLSFCIDRELTKCYDITAKVVDKKGKIALLLRDDASEYHLQQVGRDFIANASHELRTPITIIKGFSETLLDLPKISEEMLENFIEKIARNCQRMESLVKNLLTLADLDYLPINRIRKCDLIVLIDNCVHTLLTVYKEAQVETWYNQDVITIFGDPELLELAIANLLENGVKYSQSAAKLKITIEQLPKQVRLSIADCGMGIPDADLKHIFERFYTVNKARSRRFGGSGLGLSIVKTIVKKHDGVITVDSKEGKGTTFTLQF